MKIFLLNKQKFDCVDSDVRRPITDGVALFYEIRKKHLARPVEFVSGFADLNSEKIHRMCVNRLILKPAMGETLINHVTSVISVY